MTVSPTKPPRPVKVALALSTDKKSGAGDTPLGSVTVPKAKHGKPKKSTTVRLPAGALWPSLPARLHGEKQLQGGGDHDRAAGGPARCAAGVPAAPPGASPGPGPGGPSADTTPPDTVFTESPGTYAPTRTPRFAFASSEAGSSFECREGDAAFTACSSPVTLGPLADGPGYRFEVRATDAPIDPTPASDAFAVSPPPPPTGPSDGTRAVGGGDRAAGQCPGRFPGKR